MIPHVLTIAGSDPSGGAGIQADLKSIMACGGYGMAAIAALTAQSTQGVTGVHVPPASFLRQQLDTLSDDIDIHAVKVGMLPTPEIVETVIDWLDALPVAPAVVVDPVMIASSGDRLIDDSAVAALGRLIERADVVTPNLPELAALLGEPVAQSWPFAREQAARLARRHDVLVLVKGGHLPGDETPDALIGADGAVAQFLGSRIETTSTHGTGCSLSSALATIHARTGDWAVATRLARTWLREAIAAAGELEVGRPGGHGPLHHAHALWDGRGFPGAGADLAAWWESTEPLRAAIDDVWFVRQLADGSLPSDDFAHYLGQDALYLRCYARGLSRAAELAPTAVEREFWQRGAAACLESELAMHEERGAVLTGTDSEPEPSDETVAYLSHLAAAAGTGDYGTLIAAVLPCYWLYQDLGEKLAKANHPQHPYADWLTMYGSPEFAESTRQAIAWVQQAARTAPHDRLSRMRAAFEESCRHELAFFGQKARSLV
ncbi:bifunctional hydroxymethylpyrimidine kinase/phosphomethylpyrimidine kinase [Microbacterium phosphatis]|uniref:bifunctional hydroxymethylpyrimidine kinase/phosphomethylpyrimidine kinase n=1 Tax=Microbacterium phosphatis TaxID=3140248 RepID=UPI003140943C